MATLGYQQRKMNTIEQPIMTMDLRRVYYYYQLNIDFTHMYEILFNAHDSNGVIQI